MRSKWNMDYSVVWVSRKVNMQSEKAVLTYSKFHKDKRTRSNTL